jgi:hypothetical protein
MCTKWKLKGDERMKRVIIELDEEFHKQLKIFCFTKGITLKDYISGCVKKDLESRKKEQTR